MQNVSEEESKSDLFMIFFFIKSLQSILVFHKLNSSNNSIIYKFIEVESIAKNNFFTSNNSFACKFVYFFCYFLVHIDLKSKVQKAIQYLLCSQRVNYN